MSNDTFWAECRAREEAARGQQADESACGTCRDNVANGKQVEHDGCARRTLLLEAPDMPSYEVLVEMTMEEREALPARFHVPQFDDLGVPNAWLCRVCWTEGVVTSWPCNTAMKHGATVFTPNHEAERQQVRQAKELAELVAEVARLKAELAKYVGKEPTIADEMAYLHRCLNDVYEVCDQAEKQATRWEQPLPVPEWVATIREAADGERPDNPNDNRRRIYMDGNGNGWIDVAQDADGTQDVVAITDPWRMKSAESVRAETGGLHEIGRCW
ncbi:hypothetical protein [Streptomyces sp. NPDC057580]|uniref:hypothetical protein n=1 Tax=Streptomyces sp. NPDC057580 TaxID=3346173 RepID=UPI0036921737